MATSSSPGRWLVLLVVVIAGGGLAAWWFLLKPPSPQPVDEAARWELNNRGVALMERFEYHEAIAVFEKLVRDYPDWLPGHINLGIAALNLVDPPYLERALGIFDEVLKKDPHNNYAEFCTGIIRQHQGNSELAEKRFRTVLERDPLDAHTWYWLSLTIDPIDPERKTCLEKAVELDPYLIGAVYGLSQALRDDPKKHKELIARQEQLTANLWFTPNRIRYAEMGKYAEVIGRHPRESATAVGPLPLLLRDEGFQVSLGAGVRWASAADFGASPEADLHRAVRERFGGTIAVFDFDGDGKLDVFLAAATLRDGALHDVLLVHDGHRKLRDATQEAGLAGLPASFGCTVADYDNDRRPDLLLTGAFGIRLLRNAGEGKGRFKDVTKEAGLNAAGVALSAAFVDIDQDADLDFVVTRAGATVADGLGNLAKPGAGRPMLWLNVGEALAQEIEGKTPPLTTKFRGADDLLPKDAAATNLAIGDFDGDRDVDLLLLAAGARPMGVLNDRLLKFHDWTIPEETAPAAAWNGAAVLDVNRDDRSDVIVLAKGSKPLVLQQAGTTTAPQFEAGVTDAPPLVQAQAIDFDLDGLVDVVALTAERRPILLHNQARRLVRVREALGGDASWPKDIAAVLACDFDNQCRADLLVWSESAGLQLHRNQGNNSHGLPVTLTGIRNNGRETRCNADGIGARVSAQVRDHWTAVEIATFHAGLAQSRQPLLLGLGKAAHADFLSLRWPDGVWQAEVNLPACQPALVRQTNRKPTSCPVIFAWNGNGYTFVTDFIGAGTIGEPLVGGGFRAPRPEESVAIPAGQLVAKEGRYLFKLAEPMDEVIYLERLELAVVDHPKGKAVYPDERFPLGKNGPTQDLLVFDHKQAKYPLNARDHRGRDMTEALRHWDRRTVDRFAKRSWIGWAEEHWVELDFGAQLARFGAKDRLGLFLAGWTDYPYPESIFAADQAGFQLLPPVLERLDADGNWRTIAADLSFPAGLPRMMTYDVTGLLTGPNCKLRIRTNMQVYWDQVFVAPVEERIRASLAHPGSEKDAVAANAAPARQPADGIRVHELAVEGARLDQRGITQEYSPDGKAPTLYAYDRLDPAPVTRLEGKLTRFGDVTELLHERDDRFVIFGPGDEVSVAFDATKLPPLRAGWKRSFVLRTWGYCKDASPFTAHGGTIGPLPFQAMSNFPYGPEERYPTTPRHEEYQRVWNTRVIGSRDRR